MSGPTLANRITRLQKSAQRELPPMIQTGAFLSIAEVSKLINVSKSTIYRWMQERRFPRPLIITSQMRRWDRADLDHWIDRQRAATRFARGPRSLGRRPSQALAVWERDRG